MSINDRLLCASDIEIASCECINQMQLPVIANPWLPANDQDRPLVKRT